MVGCQLQSDIKSFLVIGPGGRFIEAFSLERDIAAVVRRALDGILLLGGERQGEEFSGGGKHGGARALSDAMIYHIEEPDFAAGVTQLGCHTRPARKFV